MSIQTINPTTNKTVRSFEEMTNRAVDAAVVEAVKAFDGGMDEFVNKKLIRISELTNLF